MSTFEFDDNITVTIERGEEADYQVRVLEAPETEDGFGSVLVTGFPTYDLAVSFVMWADFEPESREWPEIRRRGLKLHWTRLQ